MSAIHIHNHNFHEEVINSEKPVLVDFWAPWCGPCRMVLPIVEEIAAEHPEYKVVKINVDEEAELASRPEQSAGRPVTNSIGFTLS